MLDPTTPIRLVDNQTGVTISASTYARVRSLRNRADRMDQAYGAVRYIVVIDFID